MFIDTAALTGNLRNLTFSSAAFDRRAGHADSFLAVWPARLSNVRCNAQLGLGGMAA